MSLYSLTKEKVEELKAKIVSKKAQIDTLEKQTIETLWLTDLDKFAEIYKTDLSYRNNSAQEGRPSLAT